MSSIRESKKAVGFVSRQLANHLVMQGMFVLSLALFAGSPLAHAASSDKEARYIVAYHGDALKAAVKRLRARGSISMSTRAAVALVKERALKRLAIKPIAAAGDDGYVVKVTHAQAEALAKRMNNQYMFIEPDYKVKIAAVPNDPHYASGLLWGLHQSNDIDMDAPEAWDIGTGDGSVVVGVIDTGVDYQHTDLINNRWVNSGEIGGNGIDDDGNGYVDDVYGYDFHNRDSNPMDDHVSVYHGTHVAGTIGARGDNGVGVVGVAWNVKIAALKVLASNGSGYTSSIISAIDYATALKTSGVNIRVLNASLGGGGYSSAFVAALNRANAAGIVFVAAAGNSNSNNDTAPSYPCSYAVANMICVASISADGSRSSFSNYGAKSVHIGAPGQSIYSTKVGNGYQYLSGTSMATPQVAGVAAMMLMENPALTVAQVRTYILSTGSARSSMVGKTTSGRMVNLLGAMQAASNATLSISGRVATSANVPIVGATVSISYFGSTTTDSSGNYSFSNMPAGINYSISVKHARYYFTTSVATGTLSSTTSRDFQGTLGGTVSGRLLKKNGTAYPDRTLTVYTAGTGTVKVRTDSRGYFKAYGMRPGQTFTVDSFINANPRKRTGKTTSSNVNSGTYRLR